VLNESLLEDCAHSVESVFFDVKYILSYQIARQVPSNIFPGVYFDRICGEQQIGFVLKVIVLLRRSQKKIV
jgi:hypothetical protein